jgi:hypothetical protein
MLLTAEARDGFAGSDLLAADRPMWSVPVEILWERESSFVVKTQHGEPRTLTVEKRGILAVEYHDLPFESFNLADDVEKEIMKWICEFPGADSKECDQLESPGSPTPVSSS